VFSLKLYISSLVISVVHRIPRGFLMVSSELVTRSTRHTGVVTVSKLATKANKETGGTKYIGPDENQAVKID